MTSRFFAKRKNDEDSVFDFAGGMSSVDKRPVVNCCPPIACKGSPKADDSENVQGIFSHRRLPSLTGVLKSSGSSPKQKKKSPTMRTVFRKTSNSLKTCVIYKGIEPKRSSKNWTGPPEITGGCVSPSSHKGRVATADRCTSLRKKPLGPSLSWDLERRSRSPSTTSRSRVHSADNDTEEPHSGEFDDPEGLSERLDLERSCLHCSFSATFKKNTLKFEIESAVKRLARRLGTGSTSSWPRCHTDDTPSTSTRFLRGSSGTPDIIVSSISSDEDTETHTLRTSTDRGSSSIATSETSSQCSTTSISPNGARHFNDLYYANEHLMDAPASESLIYRICQIDLEECRDEALAPMDRLKLPGTHNGHNGSDSSSPPRSNSVDLSTLRRDIELFSVSSGDSDCGSDGDYEPSTPAESVRTVRSRSHEPSQDHLLRRPSRIEHLSEIFRKALAKSPVVKRAAALQEHEHKAVNKHRTSRYWLDDYLFESEHIWLPSTGPGSAANSSADTECYIGDKDCEKIGEKRRCAACHIVAHTACFPLLSKMNLNCKTTFRDTGSRKNPTKETWNSLTRHHWVHRWKHEGRCHNCAKNFQQKMFREKEVIAITCSWCKMSYHNKRSCFAMERLEEKCDRGSLRDLIVPPSWLIRLPNSKKRDHKNAAKTQRKKKYRPFIVKPIDPAIAGPSQPLLVFVNPKSGGNKGSKALHTLCWLLNPRQVFDITAMKGPKYGLEMYRKVVTQLRILICGGDGTVGWVLSTLDQLNWPAYPPMALLPLGTGNDLSRGMGWGGAFSDEPLSQLLQAILHETAVTYLDRWRIDVQPNVDSSTIEGGDDLNDAVQSSLPLTVMNNYFSIGADAHVALQFHHSRSANPQMLNSRFKNRIAYGGLGTIDLFKRSWKDLSDFITIECDGVDLTSKIKEFKFHCILFHNITFYAGGTIPWGSDTSDEFLRPSSCDGKIEVLGFTTATLAALQMGGKGERIAQCSRAKITTLKAIPMQVDGEPCLLAPSVVNLLFHSKVPMLRREKKNTCTPGIIRKTSKQPKPSVVESPLQSTSVIMQLPVIVVGRHDYDMYRDSFERLKDTAYEIGILSIESEVELEAARIQIQKLLGDHPCLPYEPGKDWRFLDYVTNAEEGTFRVSRHQEHVHSISDICNLDECLMVLDDAFPSMTHRSANVVSDVIFTPSSNSDGSKDDEDATTASLSSLAFSVSTGAASTVDTPSSHSS